MIRSERKGRLVTLSDYKEITEDLCRIEGIDLISVVKSAFCEITVCTSEPLNENSLGLISSQGVRGTKISFVCPKVVEFNEYFRID